MNKVAKIRFLLFFLYFYTFGDFVLKFLPISDFTFIILRTIPEYIIIFSGLVSLLIIGIKGSKYYKKFALYILIFLIYLVLNYIVKARTISGLFNLLAFIRFLPIVFFVTSINFDEDDLEKIVKAFFVIGLAQVFFGIAQKSSILNPHFFLPRASTQSILGATVSYKINDFLDSGGILGSVLHSPSFAFLLNLMTLVIFTSKKRIFEKSVFKYSLVIITGYLILFSFSVLSTLLFFFIVIYFTVIKRLKKKSTLVFLLSAFPFILYFLVYFLFINNNPISEELRNRLSENFFVNGLMVTRLWILLKIAPSVLFHSPALGLGPDQEIARNLLANFTGESRILVYSAFEDVYWATILIFYGIIGLFFYLNIFRLIASNLKRLSNHYMTNAVVIEFFALQKAFFLMFALYAFFIMVPEIRITSYIFWLNIGILLSIIKHNDE